MKYIERSVFAVAIIIAVLAINAPAWAEDEFLPDGFMLRFGGYQVRNADTIARLDSNNLPAGVYIDFSDTLGGERTASAGRLEMLYRFNDKHSVNLSWYALRFTGERSLGRDITWNGVTYPISVRVDSKLTFDVYKLSYQYSIYHNDKVELGASFGFHVMDMFFGIDANDVNLSNSAAVTAPLPVFGLYADYKFTPRFSIFYSYQAFSINYEDKVKGGMQDFLFGLEYRLFRNVGVGAAYNRFGLDLKVAGDDQTLYANTSWNGGMLYGSLYF